MYLGKLPAFSVTAGDRAEVIGSRNTDGTYALSFAYLKPENKIQLSYINMDKLTKEMIEAIIKFMQELLDESTKETAL